MSNPQSLSSSIKSIEPTPSRGDYSYLSNNNWIIFYLQLPDNGSIINVLYEKGFDRMQKYHLWITMSKSRYLTEGGLVPCEQVTLLIKSGEEPQEKSAYNRILEHVMKQT